ncbi:hypothetical protein C8R44DRAFT_750834 [Mycena epipterygia]|nr:hypothetical protein C8R44DRAFT_750834 [Mycena epipterygia]
MLMADSVYHSGIAGRERPTPDFPIRHTHRASQTFHSRMSPCLLTDIPRYRPAHPRLKPNAHVLLAGPRPPGIPLVPPYFFSRRFRSGSTSPNSNYGVTIPARMEWTSAIKISDARLLSIPDISTFGTPTSRSGFLYSIWMGDNRTRDSVWQAMREGQAMHTD